MSVFIKKTYSVRTKYLIFLILLFSLINIVFLVFYPVYVVEKKKEELNDHFQTLIKNHLAFTSGSKTSIDSLLSDLVSYLEIQSDLHFDYLATKFQRKTIVFPEDKFNFSDIERFASGKIYEEDEYTFLSLKKNFAVPDMVSDITIWAGVDAKKIITEKRNARIRSFYFLLISFVMGFLLLRFFDKVIYIPIKKVANTMQLLSSGQSTISSDSEQSEEFQYIFSFMEKVSAHMNYSREEIKKLSKKLKESEGIKQERSEDISKELEAISNLINYSLELYKEKSVSDIFKSLKKDITIHFGYTISFLFEFRDEKLIYSGGHFKGLSIVNNKINDSLKNFTITKESLIFKDMAESGPKIIQEIPFQERIDSLELRGSFALVPIESSIQKYGVLIAGYLSEDATLSHFDLERLTLLCNSVALHIDNLNVFSNLEKLVDKRTKELETTNKLLYESITEKDNILKLVSHDLNAPLRNVLGLVESIHRKYEKNMDENLRDRLDRIKNNVEKEISMINDLFYNLKSAELHEQFERVNIHKTVLSILEDLNYELITKQVVVTVNPDLPEAYSSPQLVRHIFLNLIDNAVKYFPDDQKDKLIHIDFEKNESFYTYKIADNGVGISDEIKTEIFDIYKKSTQGLNKSGGKGMGLALVRYIVNKLGGKIYLESKEQKGSTFFVSLQREKNEKA